MKTLLCLSSILLIHSTTLAAGAAKPIAAVSVTATAETDPVNKGGDAADDPTVWVNSAQPDKSILFGANKQGAIHAYSLAGKEIARYDVGNINNIDIRYNILNNKQEMVDLLGGSDRSKNTLIFFSINRTTGALTQLKVSGGLPINQPYGFCFYQNVNTNKLYAYSVPKTGNIEQFELQSIAGSNITWKKVRSLKVNSQPEACVSDDTYGTLYVGEEANGIWKWGAEPTASTQGTLIDKVSNGRLTADVEGLAIYHKEDGTGYLVASSQGDNTFAVYERLAPHKYLGSFTVVNGSKVDDVAETDGLEVINFPFNSTFPNGLAIMQDGSNSGGNQNFKVVDWRSISEALSLK